MVSTELIKTNDYVNLFSISVFDYLLSSLQILIISYYFFRSILAVGTGIILWCSFWPKNIIWKTYEQFIGWIDWPVAFFFLDVHQRKLDKWNTKLEIDKFRKSMFVEWKENSLSKYWICDCKQVFRFIVQFQCMGEHFNVYINSVNMRIKSLSGLRLRKLPVSSKTHCNILEEEQLQILHKRINV